MNSTKQPTGPHPFAGETVYFATKHGKENVIAPIFATIGMHCGSVKVDTDQFGTFSGEVERVGSIRETLRKKIKAASKGADSERFFLASEGSFVPHPLIGLIPSDLESLLFWDRKFDLEIYAEWLCTSPVHSEKTLGPKDDFRQALKILGFPEHAVIVHPENSLKPIFKGLFEQRAVAQAMIDCFLASKTGRVVVANDLRAFCNPTRRKAISQAGQVLIEKLQNFCPSCSYPGFAISRGVPGLPCSTCGETSQAAIAVIFECVKCSYTEERQRPDGKKSIGPAECEHCNP